MESHGFSCHLGIIAFAIGKIALASLLQLPYLLLMQLFPNRTQIHVITHTNCMYWLSNLFIGLEKSFIKPAYNSSVMLEMTARYFMYIGCFTFFPSCSVHYLRILISEGLIEEALQFVVTSKMKVRIMYCKSQLT